MTLKTFKKMKKIWQFLQKNFGKIFWLTFKNFQPKFLDFGKKQLILQDFGKKKKKKLPKQKIWVGWACKTGFSFFVA